VKKTTTLFLSATILAALVIISCQKSSTSQETAGADSAAAPVATGPNTLTAEEQALGWELLFDGSTLNGWKRFNHDTIGPLWSVQDGVIVCDGKGLTEGTANIGGSLMTTKSFGNFELSFDWKVSPGGNSGVIYHVVEDKKYKHDYETGPE